MSAPTVKAYNVSNARLAELMLAATTWGEKHGIDNVAVIAQCLRKAADKIDELAAKARHRYAGSVPYGDKAKPPKGKPS